VALPNQRLKRERVMKEKKRKRRRIGERKKSERGYLLAKMKNREPKMN